MNSVCVWDTYEGFLAESVHGKEANGLNTDLTIVDAIVSKPPADFFNGSKVNGDTVQLKRAHLRLE